MVLARNITIRIRKQTTGAIVFERRRYLTSKWKKDMVDGNELLE